MNPQSSSSTPDAGAVNELVKTALHAHRIKLRVLTTAAFVFGFVAIAASIYIASWWLTMLPWQREMLHDPPNLAEQVKPNESAADGVKRIDRILRKEAALTYVASTQATGLALAVGVLGLGTLMLLTVIVLNRRIALAQINNSLMQISNQLRELKNARGGP